MADVSFSLSPLSHHSLADLIDSNDKTRHDDSLEDLLAFTGRAE